MEKISSADNAQVTLVLYKSALNAINRYNTTLTTHILTFGFTTNHIPIGLPVGSKTLETKVETIFDGGVESLTMYTNTTVGQLFKPREIILLNYIRHLGEHAVIKFKELNGNVL